MKFSLCDDLYLIDCLGERANAKSDSTYFDEVTVKLNHFHFNYISKGTYAKLMLALQPWFHEWFTSFSSVAL